MYAKRDWGHAKDYVDAMWRILQHNKPDDFVIATGKQYSVKFFINKVCQKLKIKIKWRGKGLNECAIDNKGKKIIYCSKKYYRPTEVETLLGDSSKAKKLLKWKSTTNINDLIDDMIDFEMKVI